jgi:hypothetical protein
MGTEERPAGRVPRDRVAQRPRNRHFTNPSVCLPGEGFQFAGGAELDREFARLAQFDAIEVAVEALEAEAHAQVARIGTEVTPGVGQSSPAPRSGERYS